MVEIIVEGVLRYRSHSGFGPFRKKGWVNHPLSLRLGTNGQETSTNGLTLRRDEVGDRLFLNGRLGHVDCALAEFSPSDPGTKSFNLLSVGGYELVGRAYLSGELPLLEERAG